jgi:hypothetical protein
MTKVRRARASNTGRMSLLGEEITRLTTVGEHHRRLAARLLLVTIGTVIVGAVGTVVVFFAERDSRGSQIHTIGQAAFFTATQLLTVSSSMTNPLSPLGRAVDVVLEAWAVIVVAGSAGAIASFFQSSDS